MIELAPNHKTGLPIDCPIIIGGGVIGSGEAMPQSLIQFGLGAIVVGPITYSSRRGSDLPRSWRRNWQFCTRHWDAESGCQEHY